MSMYTKCKTAITVEDNEFLAEALKRAWKEIMGMELTDDDIEFHEEAKPMLGYMGDVRVGDMSTSYGKAGLANVIIRGAGLSKASQAALEQTGWTGKSRNRHDSAHNDFGFFLNEDGTYSAIISDFDRDRITRLSDTVKAACCGLKAEDHFRRLTKARPDAKITINGENVAVDEISWKIMDNAKHGKQTEVDVEWDAKTPLAPPPRPKIQKKKTKGRVRGPQQRDRQRRGLIE